MDAPAAVGAELERLEAAGLDALEHDGSGAVAEQHARRAVAPVEDARQHVSTDHQRAVGQAGGDHPVGLRERVHEARAAGQEVVGGSGRRAELVREQRARGRKHRVRRHRRHDDQVEVRGVHARMRQRLPSSRQREIGHRLVGRRDPALPDAGSLDDPLVGRLHQLRDVVIRHHALGNVAPEPRDRDRRALSRPEHRPSPRRSGCRAPLARRPPSRARGRGRSGRGRPRARTRASARPPAARGA